MRERSREKGREGGRQGERERGRGREGERERGREGERERGRERISSRLYTISKEPNMGLELMNCEMVTRAGNKSQSFN